MKEITSEDVVKAAKKLEFPINFGEPIHERAPYCDPWIRWRGVNLTPNQIADILNQILKDNFKSK